MCWTNLIEIFEELGEGELSVAMYLHFQKAADKVTAHNRNTYGLG